MRMWRTASGALVSGGADGLAGAAWAADFPEPKTSEYVIKNFTFHTGEVMPEMKVSCTTVGDPSGEPVLMLHGTTGSAQEHAHRGVRRRALRARARRSTPPSTSSSSPTRSARAASSKPSDGLRTAFPEYNYDDMVAAQYDLVKNHLGIDHLRLVMGNSMGGMLTWLWGVTSSRLHGCAGADGFFPRPDVRPQLDDAPDADRRRPLGSGMGRRQLQGAAAQSGDRQRLVLDRHQQRRAAAGEDRRIRARRRTPTSTSGSPRPRRRMPTTRCTSGAPPATSIRAPTSARSRRRSS